MSASDGKQEQRSAKDIEAKEMAQELMSMDMYEDGMEYEQMKQILQVINESRDMARTEPENRSSQAVAPYRSEIASLEVTMTDISGQESTLQLSPVIKSRPQPSFSYRRAERELPAGSGSKSPLGVAPTEEMSVSSVENFPPLEEPVSKRSSTETESIYDQLVRENELDKGETSECVSQTVVKNAWHNISDSSQNSQSAEISVNIDNSKSRRNQKVEEWKLDPLNAVIVDNDVPLKEKPRPFLHEQVPYSFCHHEKALAASEKVLTVLTYQLEKVADLWRRKHRPHTSEFQWGAPIKVGADNGSLDKKCVIEDPETPEKQQSFEKNHIVSSLWRSQDRQCKRKAVEQMKDLLNDHEDSDKDSEDIIFEKPKKAKTTDKPWFPGGKMESPNSSEKHLTRKDRIFNNLNSVKAETRTVDADYDSDDFDNDNLSSLRAKNKKKAENADNRVPSPEIFVPRRIVPPNPSKPKSCRPRNNGEKFKRKSPVKKNAQAVLEGDKNSGTTGRIKTRPKNPLSTKGKSQTVALSDNEIADELEKIDTEEIKPEIEIKPMPVRKLASKLFQGAAKLLQTKKTEEQLQNAKTQEQMRLQEEEKIKKEELVASRLEKEEEERRLKEAKEREIKAKEEKWKKNESIRDRDRRNRQLQEKRQAEEEAAKNQIHMSVDDDADDNDGDRIIIDADMEHQRMEERVQCPICQLEFLQAEIENHAANCDQYDDVDRPGSSRSHAGDNDLIIDNDEKEFICNICSRFSTRNGIIYEEHVHECLDATRRGRNIHTQLDTQPAVILEAPNSPVRCYKPISEQTESAINYKEQHPKQPVNRKILGNRRFKR